MSEEINKAPELDAKLRHIVPPAVRALQDELKTCLQTIIQQEFSKVAQFDEQMTGFLKQFGLPEALHTLTANADIPEDVWNKIAEFQKKGSAQNFAQAIEGAESLRTVNLDVLNQCEKVINEEE